MTSGEPVRYIVRQLNWLHAGQNCYVRAPGDRRVAWFDTPDAADADRAAREQAVRDRFNPFAFGTALPQLTTFPEGVLKDWLRDADIDPPADSKFDAWRTWWDTSTASLTDEQRGRVWDGLNRVRFYDVIARRPSETGYAVLRILWDYDDSFYHSAHEGGETVCVYRTRERAEAERVRLEALLKANPRDTTIPGHSRGTTVVPDWGVLTRGPEWFLRDAERNDPEDNYTDGVPQYEVVEIDLSEGPR